MSSGYDPSDEESFAYVIRGGNPISGTMTPGGNKNAALPMLAATLLTAEPVVLDNVPDIRDVRVMLDLLGELGAEVSQLAHGKFRITAGNITESRVSPLLAPRIRASFLLAGPLLARLGEASLPRPGGDRIGRRPLDTHIHALAEFGAQAEVGPECYQLRACNGLRGADIFLREASVMATENTVMAAAMARGTSVIRNAASEPHVQELCHLINAMGGKVTGIGTNTLTILGRKGLGGASVRIGPDHVEVGSFIGLAAVTGGELRIRNTRAREHHRMTRIAFGQLGIHWQVEAVDDDADIVVPGGQQLAVEQGLHGALAKIEDGPWPAFPADLTSIAVVLATQAKGSVLIHEKMFESRLFWVDKLISMGAGIVLCDPHRAMIVGPSQLWGRKLVSPDIRAGMALVIAALCAEGESVIHNVSQVERGYEALHLRLQELGADLKRVRTQPG